MRYQDLVWEDLKFILTQKFMSKRGLKFNFEANITFLKEKVNAKKGGFSSFSASRKYA